MSDTTFFHFSKLFSIQNYGFLYHGDQKISWWTLQVAGSRKKTIPLPGGAELVKLAMSTNTGSVQPTGYATVLRLQ